MQYNFQTCTPNRCSVDIVSGPNALGSLAILGGQIGIELSDIFDYSHLQDGTDVHVRVVPIAIQYEVIYAV